jgi:hypothetical protein
MSNDKPTAREEKWNRSLRGHLMTLPLDERQQTAEHLGYPDGMPLSADDIKANVCRARDAGESRRQWLQVLCGPRDLAERRIGSLNPEEVTAIFDAEWPVLARSVGTEEARKWPH